MDRQERWRAVVRDLATPVTTRQRPLGVLLRWALAAFLATAGVGHFVAPEEFLAQVPPYLPAPELLIAVSGVVELAIALALVALPRYRRLTGVIAALFFVAILPGNVAQYTEARDAFGLTSDAARLTRLVLHPLLWVWAFTAGDLWQRRSGRQANSTPRTSRTDTTP
jgi:uncharacterized membrane protein